MKRGDAAGVSPFSSGGRLNRPPFCGPRGCRGNSVSGGLKKWRKPGKNPSRELPPADRYPRPGSGPFTPVCHRSLWQPVGTAGWSSGL